MRAMHASAPPAAGVHPGVVFVRFIVSGAMTDVGARPLTFVSTTSTDCIAAEVAAPGAGTTIENDALPLVVDCGTVELPPLHAVQMATTTTAAGKKRGRFLMLTVYTTQTCRIKNDEGGFCHLH